MIEERRIKKWMGTKISTNFQHLVDGGILNPKEKDNIKNNSFLIAVRNREQTRVKVQQKRTKYLGMNEDRSHNSLLPSASSPLPFLINSINKLICFFLSSSFSLGLISVAYAQEENSREPAKRRISVPFFEEERKLDFSGFSNTFLNDALGGTGDPMGGTTAPGSDFTMSPDVSDSEFSDPSRGVGNPSRGGMMRGSQPAAGSSGDRVSPTPITPITGGGGRGIFQQLPPR
ncbi:MAG: hypothetical protein F6K25_02915 [Okeania sp. SIO2G4]|uniref:hypothetical protein n=1 Tax=unclassified Okeania TaxID=2634635 RepID=UPI0013BC7FE7|nr:MULTISPECIES: hypothetical protein [unclassified Okeania]NEP06986.1 hypothetical protein [Okeania sp. SIO4D6]NEP72763.1 hypothetical protein [Okeania sp. SIO2G5]NEP93453.1 hypothetical protein [Okeania sp. SIO2F5]NEQ89750.1 hypothetical protein [Okeania sp. SIO2G4]